MYSVSGRLIAAFLIATFLIIPAATRYARAADRPAHPVIGQPIQGGLLVGYAPPGSRVHLDDQSLPVDGDGRFVFGFGRMAGPSALLTIKEPDGNQYQTTLTIAQRMYDIQKIDGLPQKKVSPDRHDLQRINTERQAIFEARRGSKNTPLRIIIPPDGPILDWPVIGRISGVYGSQRILNGQARSPHLGVDIAAPKGSPIRSPAPGRVNLIHDDMFFTGKTVMLDHGHGLTSVYAHLDHIAVTEGEHVTTGTVLGTVGSTGRSTGPHLHWGLHWHGIGLDPALLTGPMPPP